ncbi:L,D-transpeptidase [Chryseotalea sanaruensis]|uniref:L,D-transpeptidase n=1 Tax=Chryseotalea sanaruensis TaxID=2482724 RepID=A0A401U695_9BACT|nr:L,D-transpeptidase family protein [Chryseotalea sanaruensis]GCC50399.1 L,D-transpeptidase [Chryseotalea sanaruensis]
MHHQVISVQKHLPKIDGKEDLLISQDTTNAVFEGLKRKKLVVKYYQSQGGNLIWIQGGKLTFLADSLIQLIHRVQYYGFPQGCYHLHELADSNSINHKPDLIRKDILLTDAFIDLAQNLKYGVNGSQGWKEDSTSLELLNTVLSGSGLKKTLEGQEPEHGGYVGLKKALQLMLDSTSYQFTDSISLQRNFRLIAINLERWRTEKQDMKKRSIFINIPSYYLYVLENDSALFTSKVIVGTVENQTPELSSTVEYFSVYPYWNVPKKIAIEEFLPLVKNNKDFITNNNFDILDHRGRILNIDSVPWANFHENYFPVTFRQKEGPDNALGIIKFIFENPYAVFLHDTNAKKLFNSKTRALSHGCIRMEKATELAHFLMTGKPDKKSKYVDNILKDKQQKWVRLKYPIPIHIRYFTCEFKNNTFFSYPDIYSRDEVLFDLLFAGVNDIDL